MHLEPIERMTAQEWNDVIWRYDTAMFYHDASWLAFLAERGRGQVVRFRIEDDAEVQGYFVAFLVQKGPFRILGSPLSATMSEYMGPVADSGFRVDRFLPALDDLCRKLRIHHMEIGSPLFTPAQMRAHRYETAEWMTFRIPLSRDRELMWRNLSGKTRNRIRLGMKNGLVVEDSADPAFVDRHYAQVLEVFGRQRLAPPFVVEDLRVLFEKLKPRELLFALEVKCGATGEVIGSGIFPHDHRRVYSLSSASWLARRDLCPNELLHWTVMTLAGERGLEQYSIGDNYRTPATGGKFKDKFNGAYEPVYRFTRNYSVLAGTSRRLYVAFYRMKQRAAGRTSR